MATTTVSRPAKSAAKVTTASTATSKATTPVKIERTGPTVVPRVDIYETDQAYVLLADMPGVGTDGLEVTADRDELTIRGQVQFFTNTPDYQEFDLASYERVFVMTEDLDATKIVAALKDGVLRVEIPKSARLQPKKIPVRSE